MKKLLYLLLNFLLYNISESIGNIATNKNELKYYEKIHYEYLFDTIDSDDYNLSLIYILCNNEGLKIEKEMLNWLIPEYDVYCVYQKYPGTLYEYPALRFAQWFSQSFNISFILYVHTKGAYYKKKNKK